MPDGKPTKAPLIIFGGVIGISVICVGLVVVTHSQRTEPYLDTKMRRVIRVQRPALATPDAKSVIPTLPVLPFDAGPGDASAPDAGRP